MRSSAATIAILAASLSLVQADIESVEDTVFAEEELYAIMDALHEHLSEANELQLFGYRDSDRRLASLGEFPNVSYASLCTSACWANIQSSFDNASITLDTSTCKNKAKAAMGKVYKEKKKQGKAEKERRDSTASGKGKKSGGSASKGEGSKRLLKERKKAYTKQESSCIFDLCPRIAPMCNYTNVTNAPERQNSSRIKAAYNMDECTAANVNFLCNSVCTSACSSSADAKKMLCGSTGKAKGGKYSTGKGAGDLKKTFSSMCMQDASGSYCYDKIKADVEGSKFEAGKGESKYPDPCSIDCNSTAAKAVNDLGCCFSAVMDAQRRYGSLDKGQMRTLKGFAKVCNSSVLQSCSSGQISTAKSKQMSLSLNITCDDLSSEAAEGNFTQMLTDAINQTSLTLEILTCKPKGSTCAGTSNLRRLSTSGSNVDVNAEAIGDDAQAQLDSLVITDTMLSDATTVAETSDPSQATTDSTSTGSGGAGQVGGASSARPILVVFGLLLAALASIRQ
jgi:hypothetical protein